MTIPADGPELPTLRQLLRATLVAIVAAAVTLIAIVLPSEYGIDPTGIGRRTGLFRPPAESAVMAIPSGETTDAAPPGAPLRKSTVPYRSDERSIVLKAGEGIELKAMMAAGQSMVFSWTAAGGGVDVDMHGEVVGAREGEFTSYWKDEGQENGHGLFVAPAAGMHGWFWQNLNDTPVTITLRTSGFYEKIFTP